MDKKEKALLKLIKSTLRKRFIRPDTRNLAALQAGMKARKIKHGNAAALKGFLSIRIPVYKTVVSVLIVAGIFMVSRSIKDRPLGVPQLVSDEDTLVLSPHVQEYLSMVKNQRIGLNLKDDTTLVKMFVGSN